MPHPLLASPGELSFGFSQSHSLFCAPLGRDAQDRRQKDAPGSWPPRGWCWCRDTLWISMPPRAQLNGPPTHHPQGPLCCLPVRGEQGSSLVPGLPPPRRLIYMGFTRAHFMPQCTRLPAPPARQASPGASMETKEYVLSLMSPAVGPEGHRENPHRKEGTPWGPERGQGPHWRLPSNQGQDLSPTFSTSGSQNPLLLPFPPPSRGLWRGPLLPLLPSCDLEKLTDQVIDSELLPKTKLVLERSTVCKKGPLRSPAKPLPLPHEENGLRKGQVCPGSRRVMVAPGLCPRPRVHWGPPNSQTPGLSTCCHLGHPGKAVCGRGKNQGEPSAWGWPRRAQGSLNGRERFQPCGVCKPARSSAQIQRGELSQVGHIPLPGSYCSGKSPSKSQKAWIPAQGAGERGTKGWGGERRKSGFPCASPHRMPHPPSLVLS